MFNKFKHVLKDDGFFYGFLMILIAIASLGLGRISDGNFHKKDPVSTVSFTQNSNIEQENAAQAVDSVPGKVKGAEVIQETAKTYVASRSGQRYHLPWCPGAKQIKEENKIYFATKEEAEKAGYTPAANCKGI